MISFHRCSVTGRRYLAALLSALVAVFLLAAPLSAQDTGNKTQQSIQKKVIEAKQKQKKYSQKLRQIRNATIQNNATLKKRSEELQKQKKQEFISYMVEHFDSPKDATFEEAKENYKQNFISIIAENTDLSENATFEEASRKFRQEARQNKELQQKFKSNFPKPKKDQELQKKQKELQQDIQKAMQNQNPKTQEYRKKRDQAMRTLMKIQRMQQQRQMQQRQRQQKQQGQQGQQGSGQQ